jgi:NADH dehydrogenase [ubiquinone] 1 alpha subcomplex assembly factor 1
MVKVIDFADINQVSSWQAVNDVVMGGRSSSRLLPTERGTAVFTGNVSFENNGGFASVRCNRLAFPLDRASGLSIRFAGDGKRYKLNLRTDTSLESINWQVRLDGAADQWQEQQFGWEAFRPTRHGREVPDAPPLDPTALIGVGLLIADRQEGAFRLELAWIKALS